MKMENLLKNITLYGQVEDEATTKPDILHFFGQGNFIFIREKSGNFEKDACGNNVYLYFNVSMK